MTTGWSLLRVGQAQSELRSSFAWTVRRDVFASIVKVLPRQLACRKTQLLIADGQAAAWRVVSLRPGR
jgi:hypothetical protein